MSKSYNHDIIKQQLEESVQAERVLSGAPTAGRYVLYVSENPKKRVEVDVVEKSPRDMKSEGESGKELILKPKNKRPSRKEERMSSSTNGLKGSPTRDVVAINSRLPLITSKLIDPPNWVRVRPPNTPGRVRTGRNLGICVNIKRGTTLSCQEGEVLEDHPAGDSLISQNSQDADSQVTENICKSLVSSQPARKVPNRKASNRCYAICKAPILSEGNRTTKDLLPSKTVSEAPAISGIKGSRPLSPYPASQMLEDTSDSEEDTSLDTSLHLKTRYETSFLVKPEQCGSLRFSRSEIERNSTQPYKKLSRRMDKTIETRQCRKTLELGVKNASLDFQTLRTKESPKASSSRKAPLNSCGKCDRSNQTPPFKRFSFRSENAVDSKITRARNFYNSGNEADDEEGEHHKDVTNKRKQEQGSRSGQKYRSENVKKDSTYHKSHEQGKKEQQVSKEKTKTECTKCAAQGCRMRSKGNAQELAVNSKNEQKESKEKECQEDAKHNESMEKTKTEFRKSPAEGCKLRKHEQKEKTENEGKEDVHEERNDNEEHCENEEQEGDEQSKPEECGEEDNKIERKEVKLQRKEEMKARLLKYFRQLQIEKQWDEMEKQANELTLQNLFGEKARERFTDHMGRSLYNTLTNVINMEAQDVLRSCLQFCLHKINNFFNDGNGTPLHPLQYNSEKDIWPTMLGPCYDEPIVMLVDRILYGANWLVGDRLQSHFEDEKNERAEVKKILIEKLRELLAERQRQLKKTHPFDGDTARGTYMITQSNPIQSKRYS